MNAYLEVVDVVHTSLWTAKVLVKTELNVTRLVTKGREVSLIYLNPRAFSLVFEQEDHVIAAHLETQPMRCRPLR